MGNGWIKFRRLRRAVSVIMLCLGLLSAFGPGVWAAAPDAPGDETGLAVIIPIHGEIDPGLAGFVRRSLDKAENLGAQKVILDIDTPGGLIAAAQDMKNYIFASKVPTVAFVSGQAKSAGVLISLSANQIYMTPGASIGAAEPIPNTEKILASWRSDLEAAAEARGRDPRLAAGMADKNLVIENIKKQGEILSLSAQKAVELGFVDGITDNRNSLLVLLSQQDGLPYQINELEPGFGEKLAWWIINPYISPVLLLVGFAGLIIELMVPGFGVPGTIGLLALGLYFGGHLMAGVSSWMAVLVFILGMVALLLEITVIPGFGVAGLAGIGLIIWSIFLASTSPVQAAVSLTVAMVGSGVLLYLVIRVWGRRGLWDKLILGNNQDSASGYSAPKKELSKYLGLEGVTITPLRPAGAAELSGERVDVVTEGGFIPAGTSVRVVLVEGGRVVVRPLGEKRD